MSVLHTLCTCISNSRIVVFVGNVIYMCVYVC